jgi:hypothetical protein
MAMIGEIIPFVLQSHNWPEFESLIILKSADDNVLRNPHVTLLQSLAEQ